MFKYVVYLYATFFFFSRVESAFVGVVNDSLKMTRINIVKMRSSVHRRDNFTLWRSKTQTDLL